jgi:hypothetical protein
MAGDQQFCSGGPVYRIPRMPEELTAEQAAARLDTVDTLGIPLGPGQPPAFLRALGARQDWADLRVYGALLAVGTELFSRSGVHYLSGFYGPLSGRCGPQAPTSSSHPRISAASDHCSNDSDRV